MNERVLVEQINAAKLFERQIGELFSKRKAPAEDRDLATAIYCDLAFEHHAACIVLIDHRKFASAAALLRPLYEAVVQATGISGGIVESRDIANLLKGNARLPKLETLVSRLRKTGHALAPAIHHISIQATTAMHDYTHGGSRQINRRFANGEIGSNISAEEATEVLSLASLVALIAAHLFLEK